MGDGDGDVLGRPTGIRPGHGVGVRLDEPVRIRCLGSVFGADGDPRGTLRGRPSRTLDEAHGPRPEQMNRPPSALVSPGPTPNADSAISRTVTSGPRCSTLLENTVSPSTSGRHRSAPTADVGRALISLPGGSSGSSAEPGTPVPHSCSGTAYSREGGEEEQEVSALTRRTAPRTATAAPRRPPCGTTCISPSMGWIVPPGRRCTDPAADQSGISVSRSL
jgi:hypothetical protein